MRHMIITFTKSILVQKNELTILRRIAKHVIIIIHNICTRLTLFIKLIVEKNQVNLFSIAAT